MFSECLSAGNRLSYHTCGMKIGRRIICNVVVVGTTSGLVIRSDGGMFVQIRNAGCITVKPVFGFAEWNSISRLKQKRVIDYVPSKPVSTAVSHWSKWIRFLSIRII